MALGRQGSKDLEYMVFYTGRIRHGQCSPTGQHGLDKIMGWEGRRNDDDWPLARLRSQ